MAPVVADASVLIALVQISQLPLLKSLFETIVIPPAVAREVAPSLPEPPAWIRIQKPGSPLDVRVATSSLDAGETEAIALALELGAAWIILDDLPARRLAASLGLSVVGTAGVLYAAKQKALLPALRPAIDALRDRGFRLRQDVYEELLRNAGEWRP